MSSWKETDCCKRVTRYIPHFVRKFTRYRRHEPDLCNYTWLQVAVPRTISALRLVLVSIKRSTRHKTLQRIYDFTVP